ncbi:MAG: ATP synthase F1 subunit delta [Dehalococcoidales bacterium]|nr:ATP synthase F1 subunit delta [Dehalococcoidales bacterium]
MATSRVYARRYARAVFNIAVEKQELDRWESDLSRIVGLRENSDLVTLLKSPRMRFNDKSKLLSECLGEVSPSALKLVYLLVTRDRLNLVADISEEYQRLLDSHRGIEPAVVITAVPLDDKTKSGLVKHLETIVGKKVIAQYEVDPGIIGGVVVRTGGKLLDYSTRSRLMALKEELSGIRR